MKTVIANQKMIAAFTALHVDFDSAIINLLDNLKYTATEFRVDSLRSNKQGEPSALVFTLIDKTDNKAFEFYSGVINEFAVPNLRRIARSRGIKEHGVITIVYTEPCEPLYSKLIKDWKDHMAIDDSCTDFSNMFKDLG